jgi:hypothetical protein
MIAARQLSSPGPFNSDVMSRLGFFPVQFRGDSMRKQIAAWFNLVLVNALIISGALVASGQERRATAAAAPARAEVLVLGTYHMANPGRDIFNTQADDVFAPKRQAEIAQLIEVLKKFRPTKIAIESDPFGPRVGQYSDYLTGKYTLTRNEIDQLGFRLAKELGHKTIYPVDADGEYPYPRVEKYARATGRSLELNAIIDVFAAEVKAQNEYLASHTILETLLYMNADDKIALANRQYFQLAHFSEPGDWAGPDLVSDWFRRNMRIFGNIGRIADSPNDRVLVIYGAGHLGFLQHDFANDPNFALRKLDEFAK